YPFILNDASFRIPGYIAAAALLIFIFYLVKHCFPAWKHMQEPSSHPIAKRIESWGDFIGVAVATERESLSPRYGGKNGWMITDQFLIQSTFFTFDVLRLSDLLWAYKTVTRHSVNFIPTGKTYAAVMICYGGAARIESSEKTTEEILGFVAQRAP